MTKSAHSRLKWVVGILAAWLACVGLYLAFSGNLSLKRATDDLNETGFFLHRLISQRAAQHDAHLTTLVPLILAGENGQAQPLEQVSESIMRFYPRIAAIQVIELTWQEPSARTNVRPLLSIPADAVQPDYRSISGQIFVQKAGEGKSYKDTASTTRYLLTKKVQDTNPALALVMQVDAKRLVDAEDLPDWLSMHLELDGAAILERHAAAQSSSLISVPQFTRMIDSQSQPLLLKLERSVALADLVDPMAFWSVSLASLVCLLLIGRGWRHQIAVKRLQAAAEMAEQRNALLERETRLAHAARVNSLGELASGIAHELTQPLTALMSQSQAAQRLLDQSGNDDALLKRALAANVREAKRAGDMLKRMRDYIRNRPPKRVSTQINQIVRDTAELMRADLDNRSVVLQLVLEPDLPSLMADPVELEQVLHNLIRNAADSLDEANILAKHIVVETIRDVDCVRIDIRDNGPGITDDILPRLFEPFFTTKNDGMGLGLALCATLVERIGGRIEARNAESGGAVFSVMLPIRNEEADA